jgi:tRNA(Ile)-lysidine synthase
MSVHSRVLRTIRKHDMLPRGARVLVALSGGPDSVALLHVLRTLEARGELVVAAAAHFNHQLRGAEADADETFCRDLAAGTGVPFLAGRADVAARARETGRSLEDAARQARYEFLNEAADSAGAAAIAVGHSLDDQAETFLLRLIRGAGPAGLAGIRPRAGRVVRPLLDISRAELRQYAAEHGLGCRDDSSNADVRIPRNRVRLELLPQLSQFSPAIAATLAREAALAREDEEFLDRLAIESAASIVLVESGNVTVDVAGLTALPPALASRVSRKAIAAAAPGRFIGFQHIDDLLELARSGAEGGALALPGVTAVRRGSGIVLGIAPERPFSNSFRFPLSIPGEVAVPGWALSAARIEDSEEVTPPPARGNTAVVAAATLRGPLAVRSRRPGDIFRPLGMHGRGRKLQDFLVDRKIARADRDSLPLVVDQDDRIVWVVGQSVAEDFRVTGPEQGVILLKARRLGGLG